MQHSTFKNFAVRAAVRAVSEGAEEEIVGAIAPQPFGIR